MNSAPAPTNPFPGLRPFRPEEESLFFGREAQVDAMVDKLAATRFLAVVGTSGCGKSSLVNCGLLPALHRGLMASAGSVWHVVMMRPGSQPLVALSEALATPGALGALGACQGERPGNFTPAEMIEANLRMGKLGLVDVVEQARLPKGQNLLLVVDQFEEMFRYQSLAQAAGTGPPPARARADATAFVNLLLEACAHGDVPLYVVLSMRSDFLGDCAAFHGLPEAINRGQYLVPRMTRNERRSAITGPVGVGGAQIDPVLLTRLVNDVGEDPDQLSILQHALNRTWAQWEKDGRQGPLSMRHYEAVGTMAHALNQHAEEAFAHIGAGHLQEVTEALFKSITDRVTDPRGTRRPTRFDTLCALTGADAPELSKVIDVFREPTCSFLMPPPDTPLENDTPIDISHESLMRVWDRLRAWAEEEARSAQTYRRLAETAELHAARRAGLLRPPDLQFASEWRKRQRPSAVWAGRYREGFEATMRFLDESEQAFARDRQKEEAQTRRRRLAYAAAFVASLIVSVVLGIVSYEWKRSAQKAEEAALSAERATRQALDAEARAKASELDAAKARAQLESTLNVLQQQPTWDSTYGSAVQSSPGIQKTVQQAAQSRSLTYLHYASPEQKGLAERMRAALEKAGYAAPGVELVPQAPSRSEVRYFREADLGDAAAMSDLLSRWGWGSVKPTLTRGYESKTRPRQLEIWLAQPDAADIDRLLRQINAPTAEERKPAAAQLLDRYSGSPAAISATLDLFDPERIGSLSPSGLINALYFLTRTAPLAWDANLEARGREAAGRISSRTGVGPQTIAEVDRLLRLLHTVRNGEPTQAAAQ